MRKLLLSVILMSCLVDAAAQSSLVRRYGTQRAQARLRAEHPELIDNQRRIEQYIHQFHRSGIPHSVTIPVVFHVVYSPGQAVAEEAQVLSQLDVLNECFDTYQEQMHHMADSLEGFARRGTRAAINFCLPRHGPDGQPADAIRYLETPVREWGLDGAIKSSAHGGADPWDTEYYLNIWIGHLSDTVSGYAQMPGGPELTDGIVVDHRFVGTSGTATAPYDGGKTLVHLVGSYLGLYELWNESSPCTDDYVRDTPRHNAPNFGMVRRYRHVSTCEGYPVEMTMNYMDNTDDAAQYLFTMGQKMRMQAVVSAEGPRAGLAGNLVICRPGTNYFMAGQTGPANPSGRFRVALFPNPAREEFTIDVQSQSEGMLSTVVYSSLGQVVWQHHQQLESGTVQYQVNCRRWVSGIYYVHVRVDGQAHVEKLLIPAR